MFPCGVPLSIPIVVLLVIVAISYQQTIGAYLRGIRASGLLFSGPFTSICSVRLFLHVKLENGFDGFDNLVLNKGFYYDTAGSRFCRCKHKALMVR